MILDQSLDEADHSWDNTPSDIDLGLLFIDIDVDLFDGNFGCHLLLESLLSIKFNLQVDIDI